MELAGVYCAFALDVRKVPEQLLVDYEVRKLFAFKADADDLFKFFAGHSASSISGHTGGVQSVNFSLPAHFTLQTTALSST